MAKVCGICVAGSLDEDTVPDNWRQLRKIKAKEGVSAAQRRLNISLLAAAYAGHNTCLDVLIKRGADVNCTDDKFDLTCRLEINQRLEHNSFVAVDLYGYDDHCTPLIYAAQNGHLQCVKLLVKGGADVNLVARNRTPLNAAAGRGHHECVEFLIQAGAEVNVSIPKLHPILLHAARSGSTKCIDILLRSGADVNAYYSDSVAFITALNEAIMFGTPEGLSMLIAAGADVNLTKTPTDSLLIEAVIYGKVRCAEILIEAGVDVNKGDYYGMPPLVTSVERGQEACMHLLIKSGADVNRPADDGRTALMHGVEKHYRYVKGLLNAGADVNAVSDTNCFDVQYTTALRNATLSCGIGRVRLILKAGARINHRDQLGRNCLEFSVATALEKEKLKDIQMLLYAAGETLDGPTVKGKDMFTGNAVQIEIPKYFKQLRENLGLKHLCREAIRNYLIDLDPHEHLFRRIPRLELQSTLEKYMLYDCDIIDDVETGDDSDDDGDDDE